jgi:plastocyanin
VQKPRDSRCDPSTVTAAAVLAFVLLAPVTSAQDAPGDGVPAEFTVTGHDAPDGEMWFEVEGLEGRNPPLVLEPGVTYTVTFINEGPDLVHNLHFGEPIGAATEILPVGMQEVITFTVPEDASGVDEYWCDPHLTMGMVGPLGFGEEPEPDVTPPEPEPDEEPAVDPFTPDEQMVRLAGAAVIALVVLIMFFAAQRR